MAVNSIENLMNDFLTMASEKNIGQGVWREQPVDLYTFFTDNNYLNESLYPGKQTEIIKLVDKIMNWKLNQNSSYCEEKYRDIEELILMLGKGSGKDFMASGILAYVCYLLCCMNDPQGYFNFGNDEPIDLMNVAINAYQANNVFFKRFKARLANCKWFKRVNNYPEKYNEFQITKNQIRFYKNITAHSAHSEADSFEGFNPLVVIFDEIGGFEDENANDCYSALRSSAVSRFNNKILLIFISYPRHAEDFMMKKYNEAQQKKDPKVYSMRGKSWEVNPRIKRESLEKDYQTDPESARMKYESLTGDTLIWTVDGAYRIDQLAAGSIIRTMFGGREVCEAINSGEKEIYEVITEEGYSIKGSANHPLKVYANKNNWKNSSGFVWRTIGDLRPGDKLYLDLNNDMFGEETISKGMAYLMGTLTGDGSFIRRENGDLTATWYFGYDSDIISVCQSTFANEFGVLPQLNSFRTRKDITMRTDKQDILQKFIDCGMKPGACENKEIPTEIFQQPKEIICEYLRGLFDTDGSINKNHGTAMLTSANKRLLEQVQQLLLLIGIRSRFIKPQEPRQSIIQSGINEGHIINSNTYYKLSLTKQESVVFNNLVSLYTEHKRQNQEKCKSFDDCKNYKYQLPYTTVKEIKHIGREECYDLWVEPENEFTANGLVAHNCEPPAYREGLFKFPEKIDQVITVGKTSQCQNLIVTEKITTRTLHNGEERHFIGLEIYNLVLDPSYTYYLGGDGGVETDSYVLVLFHAEPTMVTIVENGEEIQRWFNRPVEDLILEWRPSKKDRLPVDLLNVADIIEMICKQVFVKKALFDKFNSAEVVQRLMVYGVEAEDKNWSNPFQVQLYQNLKGLIYTGQIELLDHQTPYDKVLNANEELKAIKLINGNKIDHDSDKAKDFSDARAGGAWICSTDDPEDIVHFATPVIMGARRGSVVKTKR